MDSKHDEIADGDRLTSNILASVSSQLFLEASVVLDEALNAELDVVLGDWVILHELRVELFGNQVAECSFDGAVAVVAGHDVVRDVAVLASEVPEDSCALVEALAIVFNEHWKLTIWALVASLKLHKSWASKASIFKLDLCVSHQKSHSLGAAAQIKVH